MEEDTRKYKEVKEFAIKTNFALEPFFGFKTEPFPMLKPIKNGEEKEYIYPKILIKQQGVEVEITYFEAQKVINEALLSLYEKKAKQSAENIS